MHIQNLFGARSGIFLALAFFLFLTGCGETAAQRLHQLEERNAARAGRSDFRTSIEFRNDTGTAKRIYRLNESGRREFHSEIAAQRSVTVQTFLLTPWLVTDRSENAAGLYYPDAQPRTVRIQEEDGGSRGNAEDGDDDFSVEEKYRNAAQTLKICRDQKVPRGFLVVSVGNDMSCPNWSAVGHNTYTIKRLSRSEPMIVCRNQELPRSFVVTGAGNNMSCPNWSAVGSNTLTVRYPRETEEVCSISVIPRNFVVVSQGNSMSCPNWSAVGSNTKRIRRVN